MSNNQHRDQQLEQQIWQDPALAEALAEVVKMEALELSNQDKRTKGHRIFSWTAAVASLFVAVVLWTAKPNTSPQLDITDHIKLVSTNKTKDISLPDGSTLAMNRHSKVSFYTTDKLRNITFTQGEVYFDVQKNISKPFVVTTPNMTVEVLGTAFNIDVINNISQIDVFHGKVKVTNNKTGETKILLKGQGLELNQSEMTQRQAMTKGRPNWQQGWLAFANTPLEQAVAKLNRYSDTRLLLSPGLNKLPVSGRFKQAEVSSTLELIALSHDLVIEKYEDAWVLTNKTETD